MPVFQLFRPWPDPIFTASQEEINPQSILGKEYKKALWISHSVQKKVCSDSSSYFSSYWIGAWFIAQLRMSLNKIMVLIVLVLRWLLAVVKRYMNCCFFIPVNYPSIIMHIFLQSSVLSRKFWHTSYAEVFEYPQSFWAGWTLQVVWVRWHEKRFLAVPVAFKYYAGNSSRLLVSET